MTKTLYWLGWISLGLAILFAIIAIIYKTNKPVMFDFLFLTIASLFLAAVFGVWYTDRTSKGLP